MPIFDTTRRQQTLQVLKNAGYRYNFDRDIYFNRQTKKAFSIEFVVDKVNILEQCINEETTGNHWHFYFNTEPPPAVKKELERLLG